MSAVLSRMQLIAGACSFPKTGTHFSGSCSGLDDVDAADAVDEVDQSARIDGHVVGGRAIRPGGGLRQIVTDFFRLERVDEIDEPKALREPGEGNDRAVKALRRLVAAGHRRLRAAVDVETGDLIGRDRDRSALVGDVIDPGEGWR